MEHAERTLATRAVAGLRVDPGAVGAWALGFALVAYLGLRGGGYDAIVRGEVGVVVWWVVLVGAVAGVLPLGRLGRGGWLAMAAFAAFALWTGLGISWSGSAERSTAELARVATHVGVLVLAVGVLRRDTARFALAGVGAAIALVAGLGVASWLWPASFPADDVAKFLFSGQRTQLHYPLNYSDGLGSFVAIGVPVLLGIAATARTVTGSAAAAAGIPIVSLCLFLSDSRGGLLALVAGVVVLYLVIGNRLASLATGLVGLAGSGVLVLAVTHRHALRDGLLDAAARDQGNDVAVLVVITCVAVALLAAGIALADRHLERPAWTTPTRRQTVRLSLAGLAVAIAIALAAGLPGELSDRWDQFRSASAPAGTQTTLFDRLRDISGSRRYQYWTTAFDAFDEHPVRGIGPGTFEFYWAQHGDHKEFVRDAHSLWIETLAELGIVGLVLLVAAFGGVVAVGVRTAIRGDPATRAVAAAATAGMVAFAAGASVNWTWEIGVVPMTALLLGGIAIACGRDRAPAAASVGARPRLALGALAVLALVAIAIPLAATETLRASQAAAARADLGTALARADDAVSLQPYAASPRLQRALILEQRGQLTAAVAEIRRSIDREPANWRLWLVLTRLEAERGNAAGAIAAFRQGRKLNPGSAVFSQ